MPIWHDHFRVGPGTDSSIDGRRVFGDSVLGREHAGLDFDIAFLGLDVKMNADGALTRQLANEDLRTRAAGRAFSSDVDVEQRDQDDAGGNDCHSDEGQCDAIGRRR
jgi:hypothetical protein